MKSIQFERKPNTFNDLTKYLIGSDRSDKNNYLNNIKLQWKKIKIKNFQWNPYNLKVNTTISMSPEMTCHQLVYTMPVFSYSQLIHSIDKIHTATTLAISPKKNVWFFFPFKLTPSPSHTKRSLFWQAKKRRRMKIFLIFSLSLT